MKKYDMIFCQRKIELVFQGADIECLDNIPIGAASMRAYQHANIVKLSVLEHDKKYLESNS